MPSSITHELIAQEALERLHCNAKELAERAPDYYYLGAQGPDLFFFYRPLSRENFGKYLHRTRVYEWFSALLKALPGHTGEEFEKCLAYALGFCSHLAADVVFHPFVYRYLSETDAPRMTHQEIENDWDVYFLASLRGESAENYRFPFRLGEIAAEGILYRYLSEAGRLFGQTFSAAAFRRMLKLFGVYLTHFHRAHGRILKPFFPELYPRKDPAPAYLGGGSFERRTRGLGKDADALFMRAAQESAERICAFLEAFNADMPLPDALFSFHLLTGERL